MKFFHIADLHLGKMLHNVSLVGTDQAFWVEQFLQAADRFRPDAVVIAGDIYDRRVPGTDAMKLFDHMLTKLAGRGIYVFVIPGNHDSAVRVSHVNELLESHHIYIAGEPGKELMHVTVPILNHAMPEAALDTSHGVTFWLMPYLFPRAVADLGLLDEEAPSSYDEAVRAVLSAQEIDTDTCNVLVAHQNVLAHGMKPEHSESETIIGGIGEIDYTAFDAFDYVALGHIHNAQKMGRETVRYSGCPLYYDFSEMNRSKDLTLVTINSKTDISIEKVEIPLLHRLIQKSGTLEELLVQGVQLRDKDKYYIQCILTGKHVPPRALEQLREVYGDSLINVKRDTELSGEQLAENASSGLKGQAALSLEEQFDAFFHDQMDELLDECQEALVRKIVEQQSRQGSDYVQKASDVPESDSQELIDILRHGPD
ncbi:MAG: exonuclease SbcCD subunit D [Lachnospiraceae bacterium]|nr:exonuclease SbcCD subunit D [Lachnospiraceae bacterium]